MKKIKMLLCAVAMVLAGATTTVSAQDVSALLGPMIEEMNAELPQTVETGMVFDQVGLEDGFLTIHFTVDSALLPVEDLKGDMGKERLMETFFADADGQQTRQLFKLIGLGIKVVFYGYPSEETAVIAITPDEL